MVVAMPVGTVVVVVVLVAVLMVVLMRVPVPAVMGFANAHAVASLSAW
jgi:hypothetical protein